MSPIARKALILPLSAVMAAGAFLFFIGCAAGPSLKAAGPQEAKIIVEKDGTVLVRGKPVATEDLGELLKDSETKPGDMVFIRLMGDPDSGAMLRAQREISAQFFQVKHMKFAFISPVYATVTTTDKQSGKTDVQLSDVELKVLKGAEIEEEARRMAEDYDAYKQGTYVSPAARNSKASR